MNTAQRIRSINSPGWDGVNAEAQPVKLEPLDLMREMDLNFKRTFTTPAGKKVLAHLHAQTLDQPSWSPGGDASFGYAREGQNSIVREIIQRVKRADDFK